VQAGRDVRVLETTVRDGGYEIDHNWGVEDIATLVSLLDGAGFRFLEVGHGTGVGTHRYPPHNRPRVRAALADDDQMRIARAMTTRARVGVVCVPGREFMPLDEVDRIADLGMHFLRFAIMPGDFGAETLAYIERARERGLTVSLNLMQTYALEPAGVARIAAEAGKHGADWFYVVDSAGGMRPAEVGGYVRAVLGEAGIEVGLHAHNNSGLAVANCLAAVEAGATLVDTSLNGLGRATGNPATEQVVLALKTMGHEREIDIDALARAGQMARALLASKGNDPLDFVSGSALIHSRNVPGLRSAAARRGLSPNQFVAAVGREARARGCLGQLEFPPDLLDRAAAQCRPLAEAEPPAQLIELLAARLDPAEASLLDRVCLDLEVRAAKHHKESALHLVPSGALPFSGLLPWESERLVGVTLPWPARGADSPAHHPDILFLDPSLRDTALEAGRVMVAPWRDAWLDAIALAAAASAERAGAPLWLPELTGDAAAALSLIEALGVSIARARPEGPAAALVAGPCRVVPDLRDGDVIVVAGSVSDARTWAEAARARGATALLPPIAPVLALRMQARLDTAAALAAAPSTDGADDLVELPAAPGPGQALVDLGAASVVDADGAGDVANRLARRRARMLAAGTTRL
jgi:4-hydroxy 2-oxovalerate aldolase